MPKYKKNTLTDKETLLKMYYGKTTGLRTRLRVWQKYGVNSVSLDSWVIGLLRIGKQAGKNYLDVGCGTGELIHRVTTGHKNVVGFGCDLALSMIALARRKNPQFKNNIVTGDIEHIKFQPNFFDYVTAVHIFHHVLNIRKGLTECTRVLKKNGVLLIVTANYELKKGLNHLHYEALKELGFPRFMFEKKGYLRFSGEQAEKRLTEAGFKHTKHVYKNSMYFKSSVPVLRYYESAMMFRNSQGVNDPRITPQQWLALRKLVQEKVKTVIKKKGFFVVPGEVYAFRIIKKYET